MPAECTHLEQATAVEPNAKGCEECLATGGRWVHLRLCLTCGHVGCCDSSPGKHATKHFHQTATLSSNPSSRASPGVGATSTSCSRSSRRQRFFTSTAQS
ncbi:MAG: UBP-type zinc finger domain-containing protein [Bryobacterales bacterium]